MRRAIRTSIIAAVLLAAGCGRGKKSPSLPPPPTPMPPPVQLYYDNGGGVRDSLREVIHDQAKFAEYWQRATSTQASPPAAPQLDFGRAMAIVVAAGRMTPEDQIRVDSLLVRPELTPEGKNVETLTIVVRTIRGCGRFRTDAFPVEIVSARRFDGPVKWAERREQNCNGTPESP